MAYVELLFLYRLSKTQKAVSAVSAYSYLYVYLPVPSYYHNEIFHGDLPVFSDNCCIAHIPGRERHSIFAIRRKRM